MSAFFLFVLGYFGIGIIAAILDMWLDRTSADIDKGSLAMCLFFGPFAIIMLCTFLIEQWANSKRWKNPFHKGN